MKQLRAILSAVRVDGFKPETGAEGVVLCGNIDVHGHSVPLRICFDNPTLSEAPKLYVPDLTMLGRKVMPHVSDDNELCAVDRKMFVFDRYQAPEQVRGLIVRAKKILSEGMTSSATRQIAEEFDSYWSQVSDLGAAHPEGDMTQGAQMPLTTSQDLSFDPEQGKPNTVSELIEWANYWDPLLGENITRAISKGDFKDPRVIIHAPNAAIGAKVLVSARGSQFQKTLERPGSWKKFVDGGGAHQLKIERFKARSFDLETLFATNGRGEHAPLIGRHVVLVGCGAIGGYLARMLCQLGAGLRGTLTLIDPDALDFGNARRHFLGLKDVGRNKAVACKDAIATSFPNVCIRDVAENATSRTANLEEADLIIDATGEQGFSEWLNEWAIERRNRELETPSIQYVWIEGHGSAVQCFLFEEDSFACYRCLGMRFSALREPPPEPVVACGEQHSTPYGPSAPSAAASLATTQICDWADGNSRPLLRTLRLDWKGTIKRDPTNPKKAKTCPACESQTR